MVSGANIVPRIYRETVNCWECDRKFTTSPKCGRVENKARRQRWKRELRELVSES
jgi:hypothetical protein